MYGYEVPKDSIDTIWLNTLNGNTKWQDAAQLELQQLQEYNTFTNEGCNAPEPAGYQQICVHLIYAVKHDLYHKAHLVANGNMTDVPVDSVYSSVVLL